jgi:hypothetical protein
VIGCALLAGHTCNADRGRREAEGLGVPVRLYLVVIMAMFVLGWATGNWLIMVGSRGVHRQRFHPRLGPSSSARRSGCTWRS